MNEINPRGKLFVLFSFFTSPSLARILATLSSVDLL